MKVFATIWLIALLACSQAAFAALLTREHPLQPPLEAFFPVTGIIVQETDTDIEVKSWDSTVVFNLAGPYIVDAVTGQPLRLQDRKTDHVMVYCGPSVNSSLPSISNPIVIICDIPQDYRAPQYAWVESLTKADDHVKVTANGGSFTGWFTVTIPRDAPIFPYGTQTHVTIDNIEVGSDLLLWYPYGQATAQKTVILGKAQRGLVAIHMGSSVVIQHVNGAKATLYTYTIRGNGHYVKLRDVAYRLSGTATPFDVSWDGANDAIVLTSGRPYTPGGGEMQHPRLGLERTEPTTAKIYLDGKEIALIAYRINGNHYVDLHDLRQALDLGYTPIGYFAAM